MKTVIETSDEALPPLATAIASHPFVKGMTPERLKTLTDSAMFKKFERGEMIFHEGEPANRFYLICEGKVALESRRGEQEPQFVQFIGEGEALGWSWLFPPYYWHFDARAVEPTTAIFFYGTRLRNQCEEDPALGYELMKRMAGIVIKRLQITRAQLLQFQQGS